MKDTSEEEFFGFLRDIDDRLGKEGLRGKAALFVFGGAAAVIGYGSRRGTLDIDGYLDDKEIERKLIEWAGQGSELAKKHGLYFQSANTELMLIESPEWKERSIEILKGRLKHMRVMALSREDLILTKLSRYNDRDRADIQFLIEQKRIDPERLIAFYKSARAYYAGTLKTLDATFNIVLREHFDRKPLLWP